MTDGTAPKDGAATAAPPAPGVRAPRFRVVSNLPRLPHDAAAREGRIVRFAIGHLGHARALAFLNADHAGLAGRPLAIGTASDAGRAAVEDAVCVAAGLRPPA
ncbi:hypothetical protein [Sphingomonas corticis]|uniref:DUF2384 domain-containing protein n=1 Tax=Sphingomonas corticis TaxID=2722791 RepID=A0ABX1CHV0_9SPHN|nr:hypothetical protein [Sphingomonas corticis]NJR77577.1 hypothetical protein [Sphingomonas corticis]